MATFKILSSISTNNRIAVLNVLRRRMSSDSLLKDPIQSEVHIPVPWGHIAGKRWGNPEGKPVLCLHGWLDNSCSFDPLAPLLPNDKFDFVALDFNGHGFSSHYPPGMTYRFSDSFTVVRNVKEFFNWDKFSFIGHSMGAGIAIWYSSIFPEDVDRMISMDLVNVEPLTLEKHVKKTGESIKQGVEVFKKLSKSDTVPTYTYEDAVARAYMANQFHLAKGEQLFSVNSITQEAVEILMKRGLQKVGEDEYTWTADLRLRIPSAFNVLEEQVEHYASNIKCPMMLLKATGSHYYMKKELAKRIINVYRNHNPNFEIHKIDGGHHVHMTNPERVSGLINEFLCKTDFDDINEEKDDKSPRFDLF